LEKATSAEIEVVARAAGMRSMYDDGIAKVLKGITTLEEVLKVTEDVS
jgi:general secretion pathway protein E